MNWLFHLGKVSSFFWGEPSWELFSQPSNALLLAVALTSWGHRTEQEEVMCTVSRMGCVHHNQVLTLGAPSSMGTRHSGVSLRMLLTKVDTGWNAMFSVGRMSFTASWVGTSAKSNHFSMASSPSRMAGILGTEETRQSC